MPKCEKQMQRQLPPSHHSDLPPPPPPPFRYLSTNTNLLSTANLNIDSILLATLPPNTPCCCLPLFVFVVLSNAPDADATAPLSS